MAAGDCGRAGPAASIGHAVALRVAIVGARRMRIGRPVVRAQAVEASLGDPNIDYTKESGRVVSVEDGMVVISCLDPDIKLGSQLRLSGGGSALLLWRREPLTFAALLSGDTTGADEKVDEDKDEGKMGITASEVVWGSVLGPLSSLSTKRSEGTSVPLMNEPPDVPARTPINSNLRLGLTAADALTPVGRGQSMMVESTNPTFRSAVGVNAILAQRTTGVRTVLASVSRGGSNDDAAAMALGRLRAQQSTDNAPCVVAAPSNATVVERFLAACAACSIGESVRDSGGDALVVVDDLSVLSDMWDLMSDKWNAFMKDEWEAERSTKYEKLQVQDLPAAATAAESAVEEEADAAEEKPKRPVAGSPEEMVDFGGTLVPVEVAERRSFFSMFLQRAARLKQSLGGGSLTILGICGGRPAVSLRGGSGAESVGVVVDKSPEEVVAQYTTLSDEQKEKMLTALRAKMAAAQSEAEAAPVDVSCMPTAIVEEMNSISDGHFALEVDAGTGTMSLNLRSSISRVGAPAAAAAMRRLNTTDLRLQLLQSDDEASFSAGSAATKATSTLAARAHSCNALFATNAAAPVPLCEQVVLLFSVLRANVSLDAKGETAAALVAFMRAEHAELLEAIETSGDLADDVAERLTAALAAFQAR